MKLAFLNPTCDTIYKYALGLPAAVGGAERQQWLLARALAARGWSICVGVREGLEAGARKNIDNVEFVDIGQTRGHDLWAWYRFLLSERPTWLYWRCANHLLGPAVALAKSLGVRTIFAAAFDSDVNPRHALFWRARWWPLYAYGLHGSDRILVQHGGQLAALASNLRPKTHLVPSIGGEKVGGKPHSKRASYVAWIGQLRQHKRPDRLIEVTRKLAGVHFVVCGGPSTLNSSLGYSEEVVDALCRLPNVEYRGQVPPCDALEVIAGAAMLLSTSDEEGFPNTFLQAWSCGTPVVSCKIDPDRVIASKGLGTVAPCIEGVILDIKRLMDSPELRDEIALRARRYIATSHSEAAVISAFERAIQDVRL